MGGVGLTVEVIKGCFGYSSEAKIFEDLNFKIDRYEILSILGPNGCGKTTLLKCILGTFNLTDGMIRINGKDLSELKNVRNGLNVGYVPQNHQTAFPYTVLEMVLMGRARFIGTFSTPKDEDLEIAKESLQILGVSHLEERSFPELSGGEKQLVLIARALASKANILIFDEPTSALDYRNQYAILEVLRKLTREYGFTVIMTTHHPEHALHVSDKVLLMDNTKNIIFGSVDDTLTDENLQKAYGMNVKVISIPCGEDNLKGIFPMIKSL